VVEDGFLRNPDMSLVERPGHRELETPPNRKRIAVPHPIGPDLTGFEAVEAR